MSKIEFNLFNNRINYKELVKQYVKNRYGVKNIQSITDISDEFGILGASKVKLKDGKTFIAYFNYQTEQIIISGVKEGE